MDDELSTSPEINILLWISHGVSMGFILGLSDYVLEGFDSKDLRKIEYLTFFFIYLSLYLSESGLK